MQSLIPLSKNYTLASAEAAAKRQLSLMLMNSLLNIHQSLPEFFYLQTAAFEKGDY